MTGYLTRRKTDRDIGVSVISMRDNLHIRRRNRRRYSESPLVSESAMVPDWGWVLKAELKGASELVRRANPDRCREPCCRLSLHLQPKDRRSMPAEEVFFDMTF